MTTALATRAVFGVIVPSTNTVVEDEYNLIRPPGVSYHGGRVLIQNENLSSDDAFQAFLEELRRELAQAVRSITTCKPDHLVIGMSAETFWGGADGNARFEQWMRNLSGLEVTTGAAACKVALDAYGVRRIGVITPYQPVVDGQVRRFFTEMDYEVTALHGLKCASATSIADVPAYEIAAAFHKVNGPGVDALVQAGTNLPAAAVAARLEKEIGKPVIAINTATVWRALRTNGINDRISGMGRLLEEM